ncbi:MAG: TIGR00341 family protein, partial [Planctomycetota bacterium]
GAGGAFLLLFTNVICVNLAAVVTFLLRGVGPRTWWEADKARRATRKAVLLWGALLVILAVIVWWTQR